MPINKLTRSDCIVFMYVGEYFQQSLSRYSFIKARYEKKCLHLNGDSKAQCLAKLKEKINLKIV